MRAPSTPSPRRGEGWGEGVRRWESICPALVGYPSVIPAKAGAEDDRRSIHLLLFFVPLNSGERESNSVPPTEPTRSQPTPGSLRDRLQWPLFLTGIILWIAGMVALILFGLGVI